MRKRKSSCAQLPEPLCLKKHRRFTPRRCLATLQSQILATNRGVLPAVHLLIAPETAFADTAPAKTGLRSPAPQNRVPTIPKS
jgi:hypothetical protein